MVSASTRSTAFCSAAFIAEASWDAGISSAVVTSTTCASAGVVATTDPRHTSAPATRPRAIFENEILTPMTAPFTRPFGILG